MKIERTLAIYGDRQTLDLLIFRLEANLTFGWTRDRDRERLNMLPQPVYCFSCESETECSPFLLLLGDEGHRLIVIDIAPADTALSTDQFNNILADFFLQFLHPAASDLPVTFDLSSDECGIEEVAGWKGAQLLRRFSSLTKKPTLHLADHFRWLEFIVQLQISRCDHDLDLIGRWLVDEGFAASRAGELMHELRLARELFKIYEERRGQLTSPSVDEVPTTDEAFREMDDRQRDPSGIEIPRPENTRRRSNS
jgi:hypothetical protein